MYNNTLLKPPTFWQQISSSLTKPSSGTRFTTIIKRRSPCIIIKRSWWTRVRSVAPFRTIVTFWANALVHHFIGWTVISSIASETLTLFLVWIIKSRLTRLCFRRAGRGKESSFGYGLVGSFRSASAVIPSSTRTIWTWLTCICTIKSCVT